MGNRKYQKEKRYNLFQQKIALQAAYPEAKCFITKNKLFWYGNIKPTPLSREYKVHLQYGLNKTPKVWVVGDELKKLNAKDFPHYFDVDSNLKKVRICLYRYQEFSVTKFLAKTIVPWTVEWLYFYEMWLATGRWLGGGEHPMAKHIK